MKKNKGNENNNGNEQAGGLQVPSLWKKFQATPWVVLELAEFGTPRAPLEEVLVLGDTLYKQRLLGGSVAVEAASERMKEACALADAILEHNQRWGATRPTNLIGRRTRLVHASTGVLDVLDVHVRTGSKEAAALKDQTFGVDFVPGQLSTRRLYKRLGKVEARIGNDPAFRAQLEEYVAKKLLQELFAALSAVGERWEARPGEPVIDLRPVIAFVRQRVTEYVVSVLATVDGHQPETVGRAKKALEGLTEFRAEQAAKRGRRASKVEDEVEVDDPDAPDLDALELDGADDEEPVTTASPAPLPPADPVTRPQ